MQRQRVGRAAATELDHAVVRELVQPASDDVALRVSRAVRQHEGDHQRADRRADGDEASNDRV